MNHPAKARPVYLNLFKIHLPIMGLASIMHRLSGIFVFLMLPLFLWLFELSLHSSTSWAILVMKLSFPWVKMLSWAFLVALVLHLLAGLRHLFMDMHIGDSLCAARCSAKVVLVLSVLAAFALVIKMWGFA